MLGVLDERHAEALVDGRLSRTTGDHDRRRVLEIAHRLDRLDERGDVQRHSHAEAEHRRPVFVTGGEQSRQRHVGAEVEHVEPGPFEHIGDHAQTEDVKLTLRRGEHDALTRSRRRGEPVREQPAEHVVRDGSRQVLVRDRRRSALPEISHPAHRGRDYARVHGRHLHASTQRRFPDHLGAYRIARPQRLTEAQHEIALAPVRAPAPKRLDVRVIMTAHEPIRPSMIAAGFAADRVHDSR